MAKTEPATCWALRVGGRVPFIATWPISYCKEDVEGQATAKRQRAVRVAVVPLAEYLRLKKLDERQGGRADEEETNQAT